MIRLTLVTLLMAIGLSLSTSLVRSLSIPGINTLEKLIWTDWEQLKKSHPELDNIGKLKVRGSDEGGISVVWANEAKLNCYETAGGIYGAEILLLPVETEEGEKAANMQVYIYDLQSGQFIKEIARYYTL